MKLKNKVILLSLFGATNISLAQNPTIQSILNDVRIDSITHFVRELTGEIPVIINGSTDTITSRNKNAPGNEKAFIYIKQKLNGYGLMPDSLQFSATGKNVFAEQAGLMFPNKKYIIGAHYDNLPSTPIAPGADDNASGTAAVIEAARVFTQYSFPYSIVFAFWDEEEQGLVGSSAYASQAAANNDSILGYINVDMLGWDGNNDSVTDIHVRPVANSLQLADKAIESDSIYNIGLSIHLVNPGTGASDHAAFWNNGFSAIGIDEEYDGDFNPFWHSTADSLGQFNIPFYEKVCKLAYATLACLAIDTFTIVGVEDLIDEKFFLSNYPNPFNNRTTIRYSLPFQCDIKITIYNSFGSKVKELVSQKQQAGNYKIYWDAKGLPSGIYLYELSAISTKDNRIFRNIKRLNLLRN